MPAQLHGTRLFWHAIACLVLTLFLASPARAAVDYTWNGLAFPLIGIWGTASNWLPNDGNVPGAADTIRFNATTNLNPGVNRTLDGIYANGANIYFYGGRNVQVSTIWALVSTTISHTQGGNLITNSGELRYDGAGSITVNLSSWQPSGNTTLSSAGTLTYSGAISGGTSLTTAGAGTTVLTGLNTYTGSTTVSAGTLTATGAGNILPSTTTLSLAGGTTCNLANQTLARLSGSGTLNLSGDVDLNESGTQTFSGNITQAAASTFSMQGSGSLTLTGAVASALAVSNGSLLLNGTSSNAISVTGGSSFLGTGSTTGQLTVTNGDLMPGNSIGTFSCGSLLMQAAGTLNIEVNGAAADQLSVTNGVTLNTPTLKVTGTPTIGASFTIIDQGGAAAVAGTFSGLAEGATLDSEGYRYQITYAGGTGNDVVLTCLGLTPPAPTPTPTPTPEPTPDPRPAPKVDPGDSPNPTGSLNGPALSWPHVAGSNFYRVYRASCPTCPKEQVGRVPGNSFTDETAQPGQVYYYFIRTENGGGLSDYSDWMAAWRYEQNPGRAGDFNGDGIMDLLWWDPATGQLTIWLMNGGQVQSVISPGQGLDISQWLLVNTGDFNNDGIWDLLWWNPGTGAAEVWYMAATAGASGGMGSKDINQAGDITGNVTLSYPGDLNGDGRSDLVWRDYSTGQVTIWLMGADGKPLLNGPPTLADGMTEGGKPGISGSLDWTISGLHDMDGDRKADVVWQHASNGRVVVWLMDGAQALAASEYQRSDSADWRIVGLGDLNGDGRGDIVWRNHASGVVQAWIMSGPNSGSEPAYLQLDIAIGDNPLVWQVKAVGDFRQPGSDDIYLKNSDTGAARIVTLDGQQFNPAME